MQVFIAGKGIISAIGNNIQETLHSFRHARSGISDLTILRTNYSGSLPAGEVKLSNAELVQLSGLATNSRNALLSAIAAQQALSDANIPDTGKWRMGFISANTVGGMDVTENNFPDYLKHPSTAATSQTKMHDSGSITEIVARHLGIKHYVTTISTACSSSANSIMYAARMIKNGLLDVVLAGGTDSMARFTLNGFNALMILDNKPCTPFDENRKGLNLGEGAGYIVLVSEQVAKTLSHPSAFVLSGYANANDAFHQTASSPEGLGNYLAMKGALDMSGLRAEEISYINLHGTGTPNNDVSEGLAIQRIFEKVPFASSTKSFTGHTLGACGGVEAVFSLMAIEQQIIFPNLRFSTKMKELNFTPVLEFMENAEVNNVMSNSFGFGGNCSSLIFSKIN